VEARHDDLVKRLKGERIGQNDILLLCALDVHQQTAQPVYAFFERRGLFRYLSWFGWCFTSRLVLDHDVKVNKLVSERAHVIFEAEGVFANGVGGKDIVPLSLALSVEENLIIGVLYFVVDIEGTTALNGKVKLGGDALT
jgi:hypothetical protein